MRSSSKRRRKPTLHKTEVPRSSTRRSLEILSLKRPQPVGSLDWLHSEEMKRRARGMSTTVSIRVKIFPLIQIIKSERKRGAQQLQLSSNKACRQLLLSRRRSQESKFVLKRKMTKMVGLFFKRMPICHHCHLEPKEKLARTLTTLTKGLGANPGSALHSQRHRPGS